MKKWFGWGLAISIMLQASGALALITVDVFQDGYIDDYDYTTTVNGTGDSIANSQALFIGNGILNSGNALESRGIMTFDISSFMGQSLTSAKLTGFGSRNSGQTLDLSMYSGNGIVELADYSAAAFWVGILPLAETNSLSIIQPFEMDVTSALQALLNADASYAELRVSSNAMNSFKDAVILAGEASDPFSIPFGQQGPQLILDFVHGSTIPEPTTILLFGTGLAGAFLKRRKI